MAEPLTICHLNGRLTSLREARVSPLDRAFLFGDGVYEVIAVVGGRAPRLAANLARLQRSLHELRIHNPHDAEHWTQLIHELISANGAGDLYVYLQVSRGAEYGRNHAPLPQLEPTVFAFCAPLPLPTAQSLQHGISCVTTLDTRWARCDIKSVALLANILLRQQAIDAGASEAILLRDGWLTEASAASVHVVIGGEVRTPPNSAQLLPGTTRSLLEELAESGGIPWKIVPVAAAQLRGADEIWLSAATRGLSAVTTLDGRAVGSGQPGPLWRQMSGLLENYWRA